MSLYNKHRPADLDDMIGNNEVVESLRKVLSRDRADIPHSMLFTGPSGCGKTTLARIVAATLGCDMEMDYKEIDSADFRGIDSIRDLRQQMRLRPMRGPVRVFLLDECHKLTNDAQNALLKGLEDPPKHAYLLLATTEPNKLLPTLRTRMTPFEVSALPTSRIVALVNRVVREEAASVSEDVVELIAENSLGSARMALSILESLIDLPPKQQARMVEKAAAEQSATIELCRALMGKGKLTWKPIATILRGLDGQDEESIRRAVLGYFTSVLLKEDNPHAALVLESFKEPFYNSGRAGLVLACYSVVCG